MVSPVHSEEPEPPREKAGGCRMIVILCAAAKVYIRERGRRRVTIMLTRTGKVRLWAMPLVGANDYSNNAVIITPSTMFFRRLVRSAARARGVSRSCCNPRITVQQYRKKKPGLHTTKGCFWCISHESMGQDPAGKIGPGTRRLKRFVAFQPHG